MLRHLINCRIIIIIIIIIIMCANKKMANECRSPIVKLKVLQMFDNVKHSRQCCLQQRIWRQRMMRIQWQHSNPHNHLLNVAHWCTKILSKHSTTNNCHYYHLCTVHPTENWTPMHLLILYQFTIIGIVTVSHHHHLIKISINQRTDRRTDRRINHSINQSIDHRRHRHHHKLWSVFSRNSTCHNYIMRLASSRAQKILTRENVKQLYDNLPDDELYLSLSCKVSVHWCWHSKLIVISVWVDKQGCRNRGVRFKWAPSGNLHEVKHSILTPRFFWKEVFSGTQVSWFLAKSLKL